jgi:FAD/FMN-containing dehydrogenase
MGPLLGGGHGALQGKHGLMADNLISARVVLANGSAVTASATSHPDLYWALKGAGHNFGILTSIEYKVYDLPAHDEWAVTEIIFDGKNLEAIYSALNSLTRNGEEMQPKELVNFSAFMRIPAIDAENVSLERKLSSFRR